MIKNEREYRITKAHLASFEGGLIANDKREFPPNVDPGMKKLMHDAISSEIEVLRAQIDHYEKLREGQITSREITSHRPAMLSKDIRLWSGTEVNVADRSGAL
jgi:hypothetical protein